MSKELFNREINGNKYDIELRKGWLRWKVTIGKRHVCRGAYWSPTDLTHRIWFPSSDIDESELISRLLNRAVCKRENKIESRNEYENRISERLDVVKEAHENE